KVVRAKKESYLPFLTELRKSNVRQRRSLVFFITFAVFCFSSMMQMSFSMDELASRMMSVMIMSIGIVLACVTLFIATTSVIKANRKTITMMKVFGYEAGDCAKAVLGGYRPWAYFGFALGTVYQFVLLKFAVNIIFADMENVPDYQFDVPAMAVTLAAFLLLYETIMLVYAKKMERLSVKEIMLE
ncbi:MAG: ABC transporter permease, partial [Lachnospiraceae bacterium]|nr:ABC transporter permease [Lachnospiraceae bacterium]